MACAEGTQSAVIAIQEHGIRPAQIGAARGTAAKRGMELIAGPLDETGHAGVGVLIRQPGRGQEIDCISEEGRQARDQGRLIRARLRSRRRLRLLLERGRRPHQLAQQDQRPHPRRAR